MSRTREERETVIRWSDASDEVWIGTTSPTWQRRLQKRGFKGTWLGEEFRVITQRGRVVIRGPKAVQTAVPAAPPRNAP